MVVFGWTVVGMVVNSRLVDTGVVDVMASTVKPVDEQGISRTRRTRRRRLGREARRGRRERREQLTRVEIMTVTGQSNTLVGILKGCTY